MTRRKQPRKGKPVSAGIVRAAKRAGIRAAKNRDDEIIRVPRHELERFVFIMERASESALKAAPTAIPHLHWGSEAALEAWRDLWHVRRDIGKLLGGAS